MGSCSYIQELVHFSIPALIIVKPVSLLTHFSYTESYKVNSPFFLYFCEQDIDLNPAHPVYYFAFLKTTDR